MGGFSYVDTVAHIIRALMGIMSVWLMFLLVYQLVISVFGFRKNTKNYQDFEPQLRFLVLVPAHNEEVVVADIVNNLKQMQYPKELYDFYILADNCEDHTAAVVREMGANVIESFKESENAPTGKPIVLQKALKNLGDYHKKYDMVMFFDADNLIDPNMFSEVNSQYLSNDGDVDIIQCYLGAKNKKGLIAFFYYITYTITNRFFQYAKSRLGINSVIGGTGFAVAADYLHQRGGWTSMSLTEDFELQIEATCDGKRILWNHNVRIYDEKPTRFRASLRQRIRWAQGHWFVTFKNTPKLLRAFKDRRISFKEFLSTFLYMYSLTPHVILALNLVFTIVLSALEWRGIVAASSAMGIDFNVTGIVLFFYSFILLFYIGDYMDNGIRFHLRSFIPMLISVLFNSLLASLAQIIGLFKYKQQDSWVKTEHSINAEDSNTLPPVTEKAVTFHAVPNQKKKTA